MQTRSVDGAAPANNYSVARFSRELPNRSSIGVIGVNRESTSSFGDAVPYNRTFGADANFGIGQFGNWSNFVAKSYSPHLEGSDHSYSSRFEYDDSKHQFNLGYLEVGSNFNPEVGFVRRVAFRNPSYFHRYTHYPKSGPIRSIEPHHLGQHWFTLGTNEWESGFEHSHLSTRWHNGGRLGVAVNRSFERLDEPFEIFPGVFVPIGRYRFSEVIGSFGGDPSARFLRQGQRRRGEFLRWYNPVAERHRRLPAREKTHLDRLVGPQFHRPACRGLYY